MTMKFRQIPAYSARGRPVLRSIQVLSELTISHLESAISCRCAIRVPPLSLDGDYTRSGHISDRT